MGSGDPARVRLVTEMGDPSAGNQIEVIDIYLGQSDGWIRQLHDAAQAGDLAQVQRTAHTLGSGSALLGAGKLAELLAGIGGLARSGRTDLTPAGTAVRAEYERVATELRAHRAGLLDAATTGESNENPCG
jgi:HPt (histidine-containing phosphotransfer) domain-containing protein